MAEIVKVNHPGRNSRTRSRKHGGGPHLDNLDCLKWKSDRLTLWETQQMVNQLGYIPYNLIEISSKKSEDGTPQAALLYPINSRAKSTRYSTGAKPFPTIIWLTCPDLKRRISVLEDQGWVTKLQDRLHNSKESDNYLKIMEISHKLYADERWNILSEEDKKYLEVNGWVTALTEVGIAGMRDPHQVKCLHTHYAHYLSRPQHNNIIGAWVHSLLQSELQVEKNIPAEIHIVEDEASGYAAVAAADI